MNRTNRYRWVFGLLTILGLAGLTLSQESPEPQKGDGLLMDPIEVLTRGPIHEAFAHPVIQEPTAPTPIQQEPPPPIAEEPPLEQPDLENAQWIPGYWSWDPERNQFLWVSGVHRVPPQGRTFVPGYWENTPQGWRWIAGFWSDPNQQELPYTPEPPAPIESVQGPAPDDNSIYIDGSWIYRNDRFIWRSGYWSQVRMGQVWVPSQYCWTPNGYLFNDGYWDQPYDMRGLVYAPVFFHRPLWRDPNWRYRPGFVVSFGAFFDSAFIRGGGFYFGNYYGPQYARYGYRPWYQGRGRYDPTFAYYGWQNYRNNPNWINGQQQTFAERSAGRGNPPPQTFAQQNERARGNRGGQTVAPAAQFQSNNVRIVQATPTQLETQRANGQRSREIGSNRQQLEVAATKQAKQGNGNRINETRTLNLPVVLNTKTNPPRVNNNPSTALPKIDSAFPKKNPSVLTQPQPKNLANPKAEFKNNNPPPVVAQPQPKNLANPKAEFKNNNPPPVVAQPQPKNLANPKAEFKNNNLPPVVAQPQPKNLANPKAEFKNNNQPPVVTQPQPKNVANPKAEFKNNNNPPVVTPPQPKNVSPPRVEFKKNNPPPVVTPPQPKNVTPPPQPKNVTPPPPAPKNVTPPPAPKNVAPPRLNPAPPPPRPNPPTPAPAPRVNPAPAPKAAPQPAPRVNPAPAPKVAPQPAPRVNNPPPRPNPPAPAPRVNPAPAPKAAPQPAPRVNNSPPRVNPPAPAPRVQSPPPRSNPAPQRSNPPSAPSKGRQK